jgi:ribosomal protein S18 acetylase RimI-like enzyme
MKEIDKISGFSVVLLEKEIARKHASVLAEIVDQIQIPFIDHYSEREVLAESKGERKFYGKWEHSLVVLHQETPIAVAIGYEREAERNRQYPENTLYISELAVHQNYQRRGIGRRLLRVFLDYNTEKGFIYLEGDLNFSIQANHAAWNDYVQNLYKSFGFNERATKQYEDGSDHSVLGWRPEIL